MTDSTYTLPDLAYDPAPLEPHISGRITELHHDKHHAAYVLAIDAWEHACYLQYENRKTEFFDAIWNIVNWSDVAQRLDAARDGAREKA